MSDNDRKFERLGAGTYKCFVNRITQGETKAGKPRVSIAYKVYEGEHAGQYVWDNVVLGTSIGEEILRKKLVALAPEFEASILQPCTLFSDMQADVLKAVQDATHDRRYRVNVRPARNEGFFNVFAEVIKNG